MVDYLKGLNLVELLASTTSRCSLTVTLTFDTVIHITKELQVEYSKYILQLFSIVNL